MLLANKMLDDIYESPSYKLSSSKLKLLEKRFEKIENGEDQILSAFEQLDKLKNKYGL